jgi:predicted ATPase
MAHYRTAWVQYACGHRQRAREQVEASITLSMEQRFPSWIVQGVIMQGRFRVDEGHAEEGIKQLSENLVSYRNARVALEQPYYLGLLAEAFGKAGRVDEGLADVAEALARARHTGECYYEAELLRIKGELLLSQTTADVEEAERCFRAAIEVARRRKAKSLELRAAMSLSRLWQRQRKKGEARNLLAEIYGWFTEGFDTADLQAAKTLLEELSSN